MKVWKTIDGGKTWITQFDEKQSKAKKIIFSDSNNGWLIGSNYEKTTIYPTHFLLHTTDGGKTWNNLADRIFSQVSQNGFTDIFIESSDKIIVSTNHQFLKTEDTGKTWKNFNADFSEEFGNKPISGIFENIDNIKKVSENRFGFAYGQRNDTEGSHSLLALQKSNESWIVRRFSEEVFCLSDIHFFNENYILTVGQFCGDKMDEGIYKPIGESALLFSQNSGETFSIEYKNPQIWKINSISKISNNHLIAVGNKGLIISIKIEKPIN